MGFPQLGYDTNGFSSLMAKLDKRMCHLCRSLRNHKWNPDHPFQTPPRTKAGGPTLPLPFRTGGGSLKPSNPKSHKLEPLVWYQKLQKGPNSHASAIRR